jgi:hypothetical protein
MVQTAKRYSVTETAEDIDTLNRLGGITLSGLQHGDTQVDSHKKDVRCCSGGRGRHDAFKLPTTPDQRPV